MAEEILHVKNMVCRRCVMTVEDICRDLGIDGAVVTLGSISFSENPAPDVLERLSARLLDVGFEPLRSRELVSLEKIKAAVRYFARHYPTDDKVRLSDYLEESLKLDFRHASRLFSSLEAVQSRAT